MVTRRRLRRALLVVLVLVLVALVGGYQYAKPLLLTGTGYAAHNACALSALGRGPTEDLPPNPLVPYLRTDVDPHDGSATTTVLWLLARQTARHTEGLGCTVGEAPIVPGALTRADASANPLTNATVAADPLVDKAIGAAFGDDLAEADRIALGTRAVVVVRDGRLVGERYAPGFTAQIPQLGWSMAKSVTNLLAGRLAHEGRIAVADAALRQEWTDARRTITVDHLMRMTSGLAWDETYDLGTPITRMLYLEPDMAGYVATLPLAHPVGSHQQYSSGSTNLLCRYLVNISSAGPDLPRRELFAPLGLGSAVWEADSVGTPVCSSYLWATPRDWAAIGQFALQDGVWQGRRLLPEGWLARSTTVVATASTEEDGYAAGWWVNRRPDGTLVEPTLPADAYWASGHDGQRLYVVPSQRLVVVRLGFTPKPPAAGLRADALVAQLTSR